MAFKICGRVEAAGREMTRHSRQRRTVTAAQRGQIIQRVLVAGWTAPQAAAARVEAKAVAAWVAAYRRDGMASLYRDPTNAAALPLRLWRPIANRLRMLADALLGSTRRPADIDRAPLPRGDNRRGG